MAPANVNTGNTYYGFDVTDTIDRHRSCRLPPEDAQPGADPSGGSARHQPQRRSPVQPVQSGGGRDLPVRAGLSAYAGYSEANRAPTPAELACADPERPCLLDSFLVADPPLKQVVTRTYEAGLRGNINAGRRNGRFAWNLGAFHTTSKDDIIHVASTITGRGFFQNAWRHAPQGIEAWHPTGPTSGNFYASYNYIDATFRDTFTLLSPAPPCVDGFITVTPGNVIPLIPAHRVKRGSTTRSSPTGRSAPISVRCERPVSARVTKTISIRAAGLLAGQPAHHLQGHKDVECSAGAKRVRPTATSPSERSSRPTRYRSSTLTDPRLLDPGACSRLMPACCARL